MAMAASSEELQSLTRAFSGLGVDEHTLVSILGKFHPEQRQSFRKGSRDLFAEDERQFERWDDRRAQQLRREFSRFNDAIVLWTMHPWERDARLLNESLYESGAPQCSILVEIACARSSDELLGARRAYHSLFDHSIEEDVAFHIHGPDRKLLISLLSAYRYEGPKVNEEIAKLEAKTLLDAVKGGGGSLVENEEVVRILSIRSKHHLSYVYKHYEEISGSKLDVGVDSRLLKETLQCLCMPHEYFSEVLDSSLKYDADEISKGGVSRVIVTRADEDMKAIKEEYLKRYGVELGKRIEDAANGNYRDFLLTLIARGD